jgi:predicted enzyme related to lactoylglutathione lyase
VTAELGSILLGTRDPDSLRDWYAAAFGIQPDEGGWLPFGAVGLLIDGRDDIQPVSSEPGRIILNFHTDDARSLANQIEAAGVRWIVPVEERKDGLFGTLADPDGNYVQIIQLSPAYIESRRSES